MDDKPIFQLIGYVIAAIIVYYLLQTLIPFLVCGALGLVIYNIFLKRRF